MLFQIGTQGGNDGIVHADGEEEFREVQRVQFHIVLGPYPDAAIGFLACAVSLDAKHGTGAKDVEAAIQHEILQTGTRVGAILDLIEDQKRLPGNQGGTRFQSFLPRQRGNGEDDIVDVEITLEDRMGARLLPEIDIEGVLVLLVRKGKRKGSLTRLP